MRTRDFLSDVLPALSRGVVLVWGAALAGCAPELDRVSELASLRVIAVQKDQPYAEPGATIAMKMLYVDAAEEAGRPIQIGWLSGCVDPPGDLFQGCFAGGFDPASASFAQGEDLTEFSFTLPNDIITRRPPSPDPRQPPYGIAIVFFAACAGTLSFDPSGAAGFPLRCLDADGRPLLSRDFVAGYSTVYSFRRFPNANPIVTGFNIGRNDVTATSCVGDTCLLPPPDPDTLPEEHAVPLCPEDGDSVECDGIPIRPIIDEASAEPDAVTAAAYGRNYQEQLWVSYYATDGSIKSDTRLVNDATRGWNVDYGTEFYPPSKPGPVQVFAAVHDNRGGVAWSGTTILVR